MKTITSDPGLYRGFSYESGRIVPEAYLGGYDVGDRLLDGCAFTCTVLADGSLQVSIFAEDEKYFSSLNEEKWLSEALQLAEDESTFFSENPRGGEDLLLEHITVEAS